MYFVNSGCYADPFLPGTILKILNGFNMLEYIRKLEEVLDNWHWLCPADNCFATFCMSFS
jgi:hypothetical protein